MTYCLAIKIDAGLVMLSDTRTNAGIDNISTYRKSFTWEVPGDRALCLMTAGNLSITQFILTKISENIRRADVGESIETILNTGSMFRVAEIVGDLMREAQEKYRPALVSQGVGAEASVMVCGQRMGGSHRVYMVYSPGNFIEATPDTPFFQIGELKYGKPVLDRLITPQTPLSDALKAAFVSMDATLQSNLSVGKPLDLVVIPADEHRISVNRRVQETDADWQAISAGWSDALQQGFYALPEVMG